MDISEKENVQRKVLSWLCCAPKDLQQEILLLQNSNLANLYERFSTALTFGTSGLRALRGAGTNRINALTVAKAAAALALYLRGQGISNPLCVICFDNRKDSHALASITARSLMSHGAKALLSDELRPVPFLSFCVRALKAHAGIMITASHNPAEYSGFKIYDMHGAEMGPAVESAIEKLMAQVDECDLWQRKIDYTKPITTLPLKEYDAAYLKELNSLLLQPQEDKEKGSSLHIVYSSLYGTGITLVPRALSLCGFTNLSLVEEQCVPSEVFTDIACPNPEDKSVYDKGLWQLAHTKADLFVVNDADADRIGVAIMDGQVPYIFSGNEIVSMLFYFICQMKKDRGQLQEMAYVISSFVTTRLLCQIAKLFNVKHVIVPTGFKYIGMALQALPDSGLVMAAEESYGCLLGNYTRDKDGIAAICLIAELALHLKERGKTLKGYLLSMYKLFGIYREKQVSISFSEDSIGRDQLALAMQKCRCNPPNEICGRKVLEIKDYLVQQAQSSSGGACQISCDAIALELEEDGWVLIRPSGTEPKLRIHVGLCAEAGKVEETIVALDQKIDEVVDSIRQRLI